MQCNFRIPIGNRGFQLFGNEFSNEIKIRVRKVFPNKNSGELYPGDGVTFNLDEWVQLMYRKTLHLVSKEVESMAREKHYAKQKRS